METELNRLRALADDALRGELPSAINLAWEAWRTERFDVVDELLSRVERVAPASDLALAHAARRLRLFWKVRAGTVDDSVQAFRDVWDFARQSFEAGDVRALLSQKDWGDALVRARRLGEAEAAYREVLAGARRPEGDASLAARVAAALGELLDGQGRFVEADGAHRLALSLRLKLKGPEDDDTNHSRYEVAEMSRVLDRLDEAEFHYGEALAVEGRLHGSETWLAALIQNNLADVYVATGRNAEARVLYERALATRQKLLGPDAEKVWRTRMSLAICERASGRAAAAEAIAREAVGRDEFAGHAVWHLILADSLLAQGRTHEAGDIYRRLDRAMQTARLGAEVSVDVYLQVVEGRMRCVAATEGWDGALVPLDRVLDIVRAEASSQVRGGSEVQVTRFVRRILRLQSLGLMALMQARQTAGPRVEAMFELVQITKGLRTRYLRWRQPGVGNVEHIARPETDRAGRQLQAEVARLQDELTAELLKPESGVSVSREFLARRARLRELERAMAADITDWETMLDEAPVLSSQLLPEGTAMLEIVLARDPVEERGGPSAGPDRYLGFLVGRTPEAGTSVRLVDLGLRATIDDAVHELRESIWNDLWVDGARPPAWVRLARFLGAKLLGIWWPDAGGEVRHLFIAPAGLLGAVPFDLLVLPEGVPLMDRVRVSYLLRFGELVHRREMFRIGGPPLVIAGPDFELADAYTGPRTGLVPAGILMTRWLGGEGRFEPLPEAAVEGVAVAEQLGVSPLLGVWALGPELLRNSSPELLHISTHGFCLPFEREAARLSLAAPVGNDLDRRMTLEDPMARSGLAFSGVNAILEGRAVPGEVGDGVVWASAVQRLDLQRTDLVVLSACRSGLGDLELGDGAQGLRRAFLAAGCRSVVSTLWDVPDASARKFMVRFYEGLLARQSRLEALADARDWVRQEHPSDPVHWAGFVLDGEERALGRFSPSSHLIVAQLSMRDWGIRGADDTAAIDQLAKRMVSGRDVDPDEVQTVINFRRTLARPGLPNDLRIFIHARLGHLANRLGDHEAALVHAQSILQVPDLSPDDRLTHGYNAAKILQQLGRLEEAIAAYTGLLEEKLSPDLAATIRVNRGFALGRLGRFSEATADCTAVIDDPAAPADQKFMARMNRSGVQETTDPRAALADADAALASGLAGEVEVVKLQVHRARLLVAMRERASALAQIDALDARPDLDPAVRQILTDLRHEADALAR